MNNLSAYEAYFKDEIVGKYNKINGFYNIDLFQFDTFLNDLRGKKFQTPLLILESYDIRLTANTQYNINDVLQGAIVILGNFDIRKLTSESKTVFLTEMETIIKEVRSKMLLDKRQPCHSMRNLVAESIVISKTEILAGEFQGFRMTFTINSPNEPMLNQSDWTQ